ncbi:oxysterol binding protein [Lentinula aciculospora]|uniref:Oxysterol binding protein n=1 Tax=Lentinula aciculospora TaxID=153920 RepID=A0A9W9A896_9AGAR|nr:oxysterol binding protein [Lentinula aciculospora]
MDDTHQPAYAVARTSLNLISGLFSVPILQEGWILKKRRKKMQGFARRYFMLYQSGLLCYSFEPGQPIRDQIHLPNAAISTASGRKDIHIDSDRATFHLKCLCTEDFAQWMGAFRKFSAHVPESRRSTSIRVSSRQSTVKLNKSAAIAEEMGTTLLELEDAFVNLRDSIKRKPSGSRDKSKESASVFGLFKKGHHHGSHEAHNDGSRMEALDPTSYQRIHTALESLKVQHVTLLKSLQGLSILDTTQSAHPSAQASPLPGTAEEEEREEGFPDHASEEKFTSSFRPRSKRTSIATTTTDSVNDWFDASEGEGVQEFVLDDQASPDNGEIPTRTVTSDSRSSLDQPEESSLDTDIEDLGEEPPVIDDVGQKNEVRGTSQVIRRTHLTAPVTGDEGSLFAVLKKNVGKDLSTIAFPVSFNEPLTLLQRAAEELEHFDLLDRAATTSDPVERMQFVAAFAVSGYAHTKHRTGRKGFNPMLAETFEDSRMKFIAEKVRHTPVEMAYHAEGENWELYATSAGKTKFWGKSLEIIPLGTTHLKIGNDHYQWKKPSSFMRNLMVGTKYLEHVGKLTIENVNGRDKCVLEFKQNGYWGEINLVSGQVHNASGKVTSQLEGKWDAHLSQAVDASHFTLLWRAHPWPKHTHDYYGFTSFSMTLNEITPDIAEKLPATDSRYRPDVRALEEGDIDRAEAEKVRVEEMQRSRRRNGKEPQARWFKLEGDEWIYTGGYWEARAKGWKDTNIDPLW